MAAARSSPQPRRCTPPSRFRRRLVTSPPSPAVAGQWKRQHLDDQLERGLDHLDRTVDPGRAGGLQRPAPIVVTVVPPAPIANLGPSTAPVTTQAILAVVANQEGPTTPTDCRAERGGRAGRAGTTAAGRSAIAGGRTHRCRRAVPTGCTGSRRPAGSAAERRADPVVAGFLRRGLRDLGRSVRRGSLPRGAASSSRSGDQPEEIRPSWASRRCSAPPSWPRADTTSRCGRPIASDGADSGADADRSGRRLGDRPAETLGACVSLATPGFGLAPRESPNPSLT